MDGFQPFKSAELSFQKKSDTESQDVKWRKGAALLRCGSLLVLPLPSPPWAQRSAVTAWGHQRVGSRAAAPRPLTNTAAALLPPPAQRLEERPARGRPSVSICEISRSATTLLSIGSRLRSLQSTFAGVF